MSDKTQLHHVDIELSVLLGRCRMQMRDVLRMGRGAVIPLGAKEADEVWILAAGHPIARGEITRQGDRLSVVVTGPADFREFEAAA